MMKRTKLFALTAALALAAAVLTGCGSSSSSSAPASSAASSSAPASTAVSDTNGAANLDGIFSAVLESNPISNQFEIAAMNIEYDFLLSAEDVVSYKGVKSNDNGDAGLVLVIQAAEGKGQAVCETLETYREDQTAYYGNYAEFAQAQTNVKNAVISARGDLVVIAIPSNECTQDLGPVVDGALVQ